MLRKLCLLVFASALLLVARPAHAATPQLHAAHDAIEYIRTLQRPDGGFPAFGTDSSPGSTIDTVFALAAANFDPTVFTTSGNGPDDYLAAQAASYSADPGAAAKLALAVSILGLDPSNFGGVDLLATMDAAYNDVTGAYGIDLFDQAFYMLELARLGTPVPSEANSYLLSLQQGDGGWEFASGFGTDTNTTAMVVQALIAGGTAASDPAIDDALSYLAGAQNFYGGFAYSAGFDPDPNSTAVVIQALVAAGEDLSESGPWAPGGNTPIEGLLTFRNGANGAFQYFGSDSAFATYQAVPALVPAPFPALPPAKLSGDSDGDGCEDAEENGTDAMLGGRRSYLNPYDFYDAAGPGGPPDGAVDLPNDILGVILRYTPSQPPPGYLPAHAPYDRGPIWPGGQSWNRRPPDGTIDLVNDILGVILQYQHRCV